MRGLWLWGSLGVLAAVVLTWGCGGTAIIDGPPPGTGGTGLGGTTGTGSGTGAGSTTTGTGGTGGTGGVGGGTVAQACAVFCDMVESCASYPNCLQECSGDYSPQCEAQYLAVLQCAIEYMPDNCEFPSEQCTNVLMQWSLCEEGEPPPPPPPCGPIGCAISSDGSCECQVDCPQVSYLAACSPQGECRCLMNSQIVGGCLGQGPQMCDPYEGCCAPFFFGWE